MPRFRRVRKSKERGGTVTTATGSSWAIYIDAAPYIKDRYLKVIRVLPTEPLLIIEEPA